MPAPDRPDESSPEPRSSRLLSHLIRETHARTELLGDAALADSQLTLRSLDLLDQISTWPGTTVAELSRRMPKSQQAISQVAARLEDLGYLERRLGPPRGVGLHVTPAGEQAYRQAAAGEEELERHLHELLGLTRYTQLRRLLAQARDLLASEPAA